MSAEGYCQSLPSSSTFEYLERRPRIRRSPALARRRAAFRLAARKIKWAKRTVVQRDIRIQIDREFDQTVSLNRDHVERLQSQNELLKKVTTEMVGKCSYLLAFVETASRQRETLATVPGGESPDSFSDSDSEPLVFLPMIKTEKSYPL